MAAVARVLLIHTGGTLMMTGGSTAPLAPDSYKRDILAELPILGKIAEIETRILFNLDSSDMQPHHWVELAGTVHAALREYDGFVVVHGTDTMAYTAAALSYSLVGLDRPVVLTGSQRPLAEVRSDARRNLVDAVDLARRDLPEVGIAFDGHLWRGNRAKKGDAWSYRAFTSPHCPPLARLGLDVEVAPHVRRPTEAFSIDARFDPRVVSALVTPGLDPSSLVRLAEGARGLVLAAFGVGTAPRRIRPIEAAVRALVDAGVTVLVVTQAQSGTVDLSLYENGAALRDAGAIGGADMTLEAAVVKLMAACARFDDAGERQARLERDVAGERGSIERHLRD